MASQLPIHVRVKLLTPLAQAPVFAKPGDACADLHSAECHVLSPGGMAVVSTGVAIELPEGYEGIVRGRSGHAKRGLLVHPGTIDSGYRGPVGVIVANLGKEHMRIQIGERVAQLAVREAPGVRFVLSAELSETVRGAGGFGSTGA